MVLDITVPLMRQVTTLLGKAEEAGSSGMTDEQMAELDAQVSQQGSAVKAAKQVRPGLLSLPSARSVDTTVFSFCAAPLPSADGHTQLAETQMPLLPLCRVIFQEAAG